MLGKQSSEENEAVPPDHFCAGRSFALPVEVTTLPSLINVYTRLCFQPQFSTIHVLIRDYMFISFDKTKIEFYSEFFFLHLFIGKKAKQVFV